MAIFLRKLEQEGDKEKNGNAGVYLSRLSGGFREFLSLFTGVNCRSLTAGEFLELPLKYASGAVEGEEASTMLSPLFLCGLFQAWDTLRFSGRGVDRIDLLQALKETEKFITALDQAEMRRSHEPGF
jgi:hypothetical protein